MSSKSQIEKNKSRLPVAACIDLLSDSSDDEKDTLDQVRKPLSAVDDHVSKLEARPNTLPKPRPKNPYISSRSKTTLENPPARPPQNSSKTSTVASVATRDRTTKRRTAHPVIQKGSKKQKGDDLTALQSGLVLEEGIDHHTIHGDNTPEATIVTVDAYIQEQELRKSNNEAVELFEDESFPPVPQSIRGSKKVDKKNTCRCKGAPVAKLDYKTDQRTNNGTEGPERQQPTGSILPIYRCARKRCKFFSYAFQAERMHWYRLGLHSGHRIVGPMGFSANDLCQGRVGDCWFLSALAVIAERADLILRLFGNGRFTELNAHGICQVNLFLDGYWKPVVVDNFLPCLVDRNGESELQEALEASLGIAKTGSVSNGSRSNLLGTSRQSSRHNPLALANQCQKVLRDTEEFLLQDLAKRPDISPALKKNGAIISARAIDRSAMSEDLAYSKTKGNQLWVPLLEKAYAKSHGSYAAISGGHIAEAFLDLTGAPTLVYTFDSPSFNPRQFWSDLVRFRRQRLPMGCATAQSQVGIIGMHAYSILDVVEVKNVSPQFFAETGVAHGNVSGFTDFDGTVRLLHIRNPHGKSEWKGDFSDHSKVWEKLFQYQRGQSLHNHILPSNGKSASALERTMRNDGKFWIDYDSFLMGFTNVDVVLAFMGNNAKSFASNFPPKKSSHRCTRAFEVSLLPRQPGIPFSDTVELYVMGIQKTRRGSSTGRVDRRVSYKVSDLGILVGTQKMIASSAMDAASMESNKFCSVQGQMFGFQRNGHYRIVLNRKEEKSVVVMPVSFGHPAASDKGLPFVLRFVSDAPLLIRELPTVPRMDIVMRRYCLATNSVSARGQGRKTVLLQSQHFRLIQNSCLGSGGGVVFLYLCVNTGCENAAASLHVEVTCRGMTVRTEQGILQHETLAKGKKFEAAWRKYEMRFKQERRSRLLAVVYQSGNDFEFGCFSAKEDTSFKYESKRLQDFLPGYDASKDYENRGIFNGIDGEAAYLDSLKVGNRVMNTSNIPLVIDRLTVDDSEDLILQRAIEESKRTATIPVHTSPLEAASRVISANPDGSTHVPDLELQTPMAKSYQAEQRSREEEDEEALQLAIKLSMEQSGLNSMSSKKPEVVDLTDTIL